MTSKAKFLKLVSTEKTSTMDNVKGRIKKRAMLRESQQIALKVLEKLDELGWSQKKLAEKMDVSPQHVNKILQGKENFTLETQTNLQTILDIPILASYYEDQMKKMEEFILTFSKKVVEYEIAKQPSNNYVQSNVIKMSFNKVSNEYSYQEAV